MSQLEFIPTTEELQYQTQHWDDNDGSVVVISTSVFYVLAFAAVVLRFVARRVQHIKWHIDDYVILIALVLTAGCWTVALLAVRYGYGMHSLRVGITNVIANLKLLFALQLLYISAHLAIKTSILLLYKHIFTLNSRPFRIAWYSVFTYVVCCFVSGVIAINIECIPITYAWNAPLGAEGSCLNLVGNNIANGAILAAADVAILILPMPTIWSLQVGFRQKLQVCGIFALGTVAVVSSLVRLANLVKVTRFIDFTYTGVGALLWSLIELDIGIICACGPTLRPLFARRNRKASYAPANSDSETSPKQGRVQTLLSKFSTANYRVPNNSLLSQSRHSNNRVGEDSVPFRGGMPQEMRPVATRPQRPGPGPEWYDRESVMVSYAYSDNPPVKSGRSSPFRMNGIR